MARQPIMEDRIRGVAKIFDDILNQLKHDRLRASEQAALYSIRRQRAIEAGNLRVHRMREEYEEQLRSRSS
jgi:hypothetical protein